MLDGWGWLTFDFPTGSSSVPAPRHTRQTDTDHHDLTNDQHNSYGLSQIESGANYDSVPVDDMTAFYNEVCTE